MKYPQTQEISHDPLVNANTLNSHFASVGNRLASELPNSNRHFSDYLPRTTYSGSFVFETVLPSEIELEIIIVPSNEAQSMRGYTYMHTGNSRRDIFRLNEFR